jgi:hypothetical protein
MLMAMVATTGIDLILAIVWVTALAAVLLIRALISWRRFRRTSNFALQARRLSEATGAVGRASGEERAGAEVVPFPAPAPLPPASTSSNH